MDISISFNIRVNLHKLLFILLNWFAKNDFCRSASCFAFLPRNALLPLFPAEFCTLFLVRVLSCDISRIHDSLASYLM